MSIEFKEHLKEDLPKDFNDLPWYKQREILKKLKKEKLKKRDKVFKQEEKPIKIEEKQELKDKKEQQIKRDDFNKIKPDTLPEEVVKIISNGIDFDSPFVVTSFFTVNTGYEKEVHNLIESLEQFNIPYYIEGIKSLGDWVMNTQYKPVLIKRVLQLVKRPVICIDADAIIRQYPVLFEELDHVDFAAYFAHSLRTKDDELFPNTTNLMEMLLSGTIYFNYTKGAFKFLNEWRRKCLQERHAIDQNILLDCCRHMKDQIKIVPLPLAYCQIYDIVREKGKPVIEHFQASRRHRNTIRSQDSRKKKIGILTPTYKRPEWLKRMIESFYNTASFPERINFYLLFKHRDKETLKMVEYLKKHLTPNIYYFFEPEIKEGEDINYSVFWNLLYDKAKIDMDYFGFIGDDVESQTYSWDSMIVEEFKKHQNIPYMIRTNETGKNFRKNSTLFFTNKILHDVIGRYMNEDYVQVYMDTEYHDICNEAKCFTFLKHIITYHHSIILKRANPDENYMEKLPNRKRIIDADHELYHSEKKKKEREELIRKLKMYIKDHS